jgi:hypothetical protein
LGGVGDGDGLAEAEAPLLSAGGLLAGCADAGAGELTVTDGLPLAADPP